MIFFGRKYSSYKAKASMTLRMCEPMTSGMVAIGDSDFGSLQSAYGLAKENKGCIFNVKTAHSMLPKKQIEEQLKGPAIRIVPVCDHSPSHPMVAHRLSRLLVGTC